MSQRRWRELRPWLDRAALLDRAGQAALVVELRAIDPELADQLEEVLDSMARAAHDGFLSGELNDHIDQPGFLSGALGDHVADGPSALQAGRRLGAYALVAPLADGGQGHVWRARRVDGRYEGDVAIKLLKPGLMDRLHLRRFQREGQILARLRHPNVAHLLDAGVDADGQPYLVMEWVQGQGIDAWCDANRLGVRDRLLLALELVQAVAHVHGALVVHSDIKPGNVLVNSDGKVKLLDFGISRLLGPVDDPSQAPTRTLHGLAMTVEFAAAEQLRGQDVSPATDVYALGLMLFVLLTGRHPLLPPGTPAARVMQRMLEADAPRLAAVVDESAAERRHTSLPALRRELGGDVERIVRKAMAREAGERYPNAQALAEDLRRLLAHQPVLAAPLGLGYVLGKFIRRNRLAVSVTALALAGLLTAGAMALAQRRAADEQLAQATLIQRVLESLFAGMGLDVAPQRKFTAEELLERGQAYIDARFNLRPAEQRRLQAQMATLFNAVGAYPQAGRAWQRVADAARAAGEGEGEREALWEVAGVQLKLNDLPAAGKALQVLQQKLQSAGTAPHWAGRLALLQAEQLLQASQAAAASEVYARAEAALAATDSDHAELRARCAQGQAEAARRLGQPTVALARLNDALAWHERRGEVATIDRLNLQVDIGNLALWLGRYADAERRLASAQADLLARLGPASRYTALATGYLAQAHQRQGHFAQAAALAQQQRSAQGTGLPWDLEHADVLDARNSMYRGQAQEAEAPLRRVLAAHAQREGEQAMSTLALRRLLGECLLRQGRTAEGLVELRRTEAAAMAQQGAEHHSVSTVRVLIAVALARQRQLTQAADLWASSHALLARNFDARHPYALVAEAYHALAVDPPGERRLSLAARLDDELGWQHGVQALAQRLRSSAPMDWAQLPLVL